MMETILPKLKLLSKFIETINQKSAKQISVYYDAKIKELKPEIEADELKIAEIDKALKEKYEAGLKITTTITKNVITINDVIVEPSTDGYITFLELLKEEGSRRILAGKGGNIAEIINGCKKIHKHGDIAVQPSTHEMLMECFAQMNNTADLSERVIILNTHIDAEIANQEKQKHVMQLLYKVINDEKYTEFEKYTLINSFFTEAERAGLRIEPLAEQVEIDNPDKLSLAALQDESEERAECTRRLAANRIKLADFIERSTQDYNEFKIRPTTEIGVLGFEKKLTIKKIEGYVQGVSPEAIQDKKTGLYEERGTRTARIMINGFKDAAQVRTDEIVKKYAVPQPAQP